MNLNEKILKKLAEKDLGTKEMRYIFGKWPKKQCDLLVESGAVTKYKNSKGRIMFSLNKEESEDIKQLKIALDKAINLLDETNESGFFSRFTKALHKRQ